MAPLLGRRVYPLEVDWDDTTADDQVADVYSTVPAQHVQILEYHLGYVQADSRTLVSLAGFGHVTLHNLDGSYTPGAEAHSLTEAQIAKRHKARLKTGATDYVEFWLQPLEPSADLLQSTVSAELRSFNADWWEEPFEVTFTNGDDIADIIGDFTATRDNAEELLGFDVTATDKLQVRPGLRVGLAKTLGNGGQAINALGEFNIGYAMENEAGKIIMRCLAEGQKSANAIAHVADLNPQHYRILYEAARDFDAYPMIVNRAAASAYTATEEQLYSPQTSFTMGPPYGWENPTIRAVPRPSGLFSWGIDVDGIRGGLRPRQEVIVTPSSMQKYANACALYSVLINDRQDLVVLFYWITDFVSGDPQPTSIRWSYAHPMLGLIAHPLDYNFAYAADSVRDYGSRPQVLLPDWFHADDTEDVLDYVNAHDAPLRLQDVPLAMTQRTAAQQRTVDALKLGDAVGVWLPHLGREQPPVLSWIVGIDIVQRENEEGVKRLLCREIRPHIYPQARWGTARWGTSRWSTGGG